MDLGAILELEVLGAGVVNWHGEIGIGEALICALVARGRVTIDGLAEICEVPMTGRAWVAFYSPHRSSIRAARGGLDLTCRVSLACVRRGAWRVAPPPMDPAPAPAPPVQACVLNDPHGNPAQAPEAGATDGGGVREGAGGVREWLCSRLLGLET